MSKADRISEFLINEISPEEFCNFLDHIEHEFSICMLKEPERVDKKNIEGLEYLHTFKRLLMDN